MALIFVHRHADPMYTALSTDISASKIAGATIKGGTVYLTDTGAWMIIEDDNTLSDYAIPSVSASKSSDSDAGVGDALNRIFNDYGDTVSVGDKAKALLKFGGKTTATSGWETMMTARGSEVDETFVTTNAITTIVSSAADTGTVNLEYHTISGGNLTFGVQAVTLTGTTPAALPVPCARVSRMYNTGASALVGNIYVYEGGTRTDANTHLIISAGEQQTQKAMTSISSTDYLIITQASFSVSSFTTKFASARIEAKPIGQAYWLPITQDFSITSDSGVSNPDFDPFRIVPSNYDVRISIKTNTSGVDVFGSFNGHLAN